MNLKLELAVKQDPENDAVIISKKLLREILNDNTDMTKNGFRVLLSALLTLDSVEYVRYHKKETAEKLGFDQSVISKGIGDLTNRDLLVQDPVRKSYYKFKSYEL
jgi:hypothetical protein